jgi:hypothetical protein
MIYISLTGGASDSDLDTWASQDRQIKDADLVMFLEVSAQQFAVTDQVIDTGLITLTTTPRNVTVAVMDPDGRVARWLNDMSVVPVNETAAARLAEYTSPEAVDGREYLLVWARLDLDQTEREVSNQGRKKQTDALVILHFGPADWTNLGINKKTGKVLLEILKRVAGKSFPGAVRVMYNYVKDADGNVTPFKKSALLIYNDVTIMPPGGFPTAVWFGTIAARVWVPPEVCTRLALCKLCYAAPTCAEGRCRMRRPPPPPAAAAAAQARRSRTGG